MTDRHLRADQEIHARRAAGQPEPGLREEIRRAVAEGGRWDYESLEPHDFQGETTAVLAVVQPLLDAKQAANDRLVALIERGFDTHMQFGVIEADGTTTMLPCADWCHACKLEKAEAERDGLRTIARSTAAVLRDTAERAEQQRSVNAASLRAQARALDEITGGAS